MPLLAEIPFPQVIAIVNLLGLPGLIVIFWYVDARRMAHQQVHMDNVVQQHQKDTTKILQQYKADTEKILGRYEDNVNRVTRYYEANVELVERYEKTAQSMSDIIVNNTLVYSKLMEKIDNNLFCPVLREKGPGRSHG